VSWRLPGTGGGPRGRNTIGNASRGGKNTDKGSGATLPSRDREVKKGKNLFEPQRIICKNRQKGLQKFEKVRSTAMKERGNGII